MIAAVAVVVVSKGDRDREVREKQCVREVAEGSVAGGVGYTQ